MILIEQILLKKILNICWISYCWECIFPSVDAPSSMIQHNWTYIGVIIVIGVIILPKHIDFAFFNSLIPPIWTIFHDVKKSISIKTTWLSVQNSEVQDGTGHVVAEHGIQSPIILGEVLVGWSNNNSRRWWRWSKEIQRELQTKGSLTA